MTAEVLTGKKVDESVSGALTEKLTKRGEFGPSSLVPIDRRYINILPQIRTVFDRAKLNELAESFSVADEDVDGTLHYGMMEAPEVGVHTVDSAELYLQQFNLANGTDFTIADFVPMPTPSGVRYVTLTAGERRIRASDIKAVEDGLDESIIKCSVVENVTYVEALPRQFIENNARVNPPPADEARAIRRHIDMMRELDPKYTNVACAKAFAVNPNKIADAITFTDYPEEMQSLVGEYPFSLIIEAKDIYELWRDRYREQANFGEGSDGHMASDGTLVFEGPDAAAAHEVETCILNLKAEQLRRRRDPHVKKRDFSLKAQAEAIRHSFEQEDLGFVQGSFGGMEVDDNYWTRRQLAASRLFESTLQALGLLDRIGALSPDMCRRLGQLAGIDGVEISDDSTPLHLVQVEVA